MKFEKGKKTKHPLYRVWRGMILRCRSTHPTHFSKYKGRGITVCDRWQDFNHFIFDMGNRPTPQHSIDRIDNDGNYEPLNCRWADKTTQARNRRYARSITLHGKTQLLSDWARETGIGVTTITRRIDTYGWTIEKALTKEVRNAR